VQGAAVSENNTLHVMDDKSRIALVRAGNPFPQDSTPPVKYQLGDHLGSSNVVIDDGGSLVNREEYTPYGETSFGSFALKRYRFTGKERDEESGLNYHSARYYAPWSARWVSCDPKGPVDGTNVYQYVRGNPLNAVDPTGTDENNFQHSTVNGTEYCNGVAVPMDEVHVHGTRPSREGGVSAVAPNAPSGATPGTSHPVSPGGGLGDGNVVKSPSAAAPDTQRGVAPDTLQPKSTGIGLGDIIAGVVGTIWPQYVAPSVAPRGASNVPPGIAAMTRLTAEGARGGMYLSSDMTAVGAAGVATGLTAAFAGPPALTAYGRATAAYGEATLQASVRFPVTAAAIMTGLGIVNGNSVMSGGSSALSTEEKMVRVTSWADKGITPDLNPGRWVQLGGPTWWNFLKTGLPGPKAWIQSTYPFARFQWSRVPFSNSITDELPSSSLQWPQEIGEFWKGILGQRQIKQ
jgi:RHS repeat-associated protein